MYMYIDAIYCICILYNKKTEGLKCIKCSYIVFVYCIIGIQKD